MILAAFRPHGLGLGPKRQIIRIAAMPRLLIADSVPFYRVKPWATEIRDVRDLHARSEP
jgi:type IV secretion system protein VirD4